MYPAHCPPSRSHPSPHPARRENAAASASSRCAGGGRLEGVSNRFALAAFGALSLGCLAWEGLARLRRCSLALLRSLAPLRARAVASWARRPASPEAPSSGAEAAAEAAEAAAAAGRPPALSDAAAAAAGAPWRAIAAFAAFLCIAFACAPEDPSRRNPRPFTH